MGKAIKILLFLILILSLYIQYLSSGLSLVTQAQTYCPLKSQGDANCDGRITLIDFEVWRREFTGSSTTIEADFSGDGRITLVDFEVWRRSFTGGVSQPTPTSMAQATTTRIPTITLTKSPTPTLTSGPSPTPPPPVTTGGIWRSRQELQALPIVGESGCDTRCANAWNALKSAADSSEPSPNLGDQAETANNITLAKALAWARTGNESYRSQVRSILGRVIGTENNSGNSALSVGRKLQTYVIAADIIELRNYDPNFDTNTWRPWLAGIVSNSKKFGDGRSLLDCAENMVPDNWDTHCFASLGVSALYLGDNTLLARTIRDYKAYLGDRSQCTFNNCWYYWLGPSGAYGGWSSDRSNPIPVNPAGATINGHNVDGVSVVDQGRCNGYTFQWPPCWTLYSWDFQQGSVVLAEVLARKGYDAWSWSNQSQKRSIEWMFYDGDGKSRWDTQSSGESFQGYYSFILDIVDYNLQQPVCYQRPNPQRYYGTNMGWTAWTHQRICNSYK